jgi:UDP-3-O-acyl-N-acetylglucosamine deacetylase
MNKQIVFTSRSLSFEETSVSVELLERDPQKTPFVEWCVGGKPFYRSDCRKLFSELEFVAERTAGYRLSDSEDTQKSQILWSPEHLAPVFLMWPSRRFRVNLVSADKSEVPMMDGSAIPFFCKLRRECGAPEELAFYDAPVSAEWNLGDFGHVRIVPAETFEVEYVMDRTVERDGYELKSSASVSIYSPENLYQIFMARTFIHQVELDRARAAGLLAGVDESCGFLLDAVGSATQNVACSPKFRIANEPAMHKILDLIGDLTFICPALPRVRIEITNGGHVSHHQIMEKIFPYAL